MTGQDDDDRKRRRLLHDDDDDGNGDGDDRRRKLFGEVVTHVGLREGYLLHQVLYTQTASIELTKSAAIHSKSINHWAPNNSWAHASAVQCPREARIR